MKEAAETLRLGSQQEKEHLQIRMLLKLRGSNRIAEFADLVRATEFHPDLVWRLIIQARQEGVRDSQSRRSKDCNREAIEWTRQQWEQEKAKPRAMRRQKPVFVDEIRGILRKRFPDLQPISAPTIEKDWLSKTGKRARKSAGLLESLTVDRLIGAEVSPGHRWTAPHRK